MLKYEDSTVEPTIPKYYGYKKRESSSVKTTGGLVTQVATTRFDLRLIAGWG